MSSVSCHQCHQCSRDHAPDRGWCGRAASVSCWDSVIAPPDRGRAGESLAFFLSPCYLHPFIFKIAHVFSSSWNYSHHPDLLIFIYRSFVITSANGVEQIVFFSFFVFFFCLFVCLFVVFISFWKMNVKIRKNLKLPMVFPLDVTSGAIFIGPNSSLGVDLLDFSKFINPKKRTTTWQNFTKLTKLSTPLLFLKVNIIGQSRENITNTSSSSILVIASQLTIVVYHT